MRAKLNLKINLKTSPRHKFSQVSVGDVKTKKGSWRAAEEEGSPRPRRRRQLFFKKKKILYK